MSSESYNTSDKTNLRDLAGFYIIIPASLTASVPNCICLIYLLTRTITRWWTTKRSLPMAHRVPFYIAITGKACAVVGGITFFCVAVNMALVGLLSLTTYLRICRKYIIDMGIYDYKLHLIILLISLTLTLIGVNDYGPNKFWTLLEVNIQQKKIRRLGSDPANFNRVDLIVVKKIVGYILIFLIEWTPSTIYFIAQILEYDNIWIYTIAVVAIQFGGVGNAILYTVHENWTNKYDSSLNNSNSRKNNSESNYSSSNLNNTSRTSRNDQEKYPHIKVHNSITFEKTDLV
ncbi:35106_t:CDS:2 [Gigaspora margarita]|uniref:35106_t:CDS:1 n=1 Tax=Gigaspora margarita TaxID=4874 RepID=A0ABM8VWS6_GIGMA|nr:35106_t:CDS:2 [Gigaspora margarita]